ncbi:putative glutathione S-transferase [Aspergillus pseudoustus]|uniref:Glutathione S-transferase n=1 Tax=Aspergillus pseudoustus TaxID=1810923 RepID=A0ABR4IQQ1_9EURO
MKPVHFFDILSALPGPAKSRSRNALKTRLVLNFKRVPFSQSFISYPDIEPFLRQFSVAPNLKGIQYTLPAIRHSSVRSNCYGVLMGALPVALHLDTIAPFPPLFPSGHGSYSLALAVEKIVESVGQDAQALVLPKVAEVLDERGREYFMRTRHARFGKPLSEVYPKDRKSLELIKNKIKEDMGILASMLGGREEKTGPFFEGENAGYADLILIAFLAWCGRPDQELLQEILESGRGELKMLWNNCLPWLECQGEL